MTLHESIRAVIALHDPDAFEDEGDAWLWRPNPDEASLNVEGLTYAIEDLLLGLVVPVPPNPQEK